MKFISWNVNGLRACEGKGFSDIFHRMDADFFCLQETKMQAGQLDLTYEGYQSYWNYAEKKGYSGTAIFTRHTPVSVKLGIGVDEHDHEGRTITLEYEDFFLITAYVPNSQDELRRLDYRMRWEDDFRQYVLQLDAVKPVERLTRLTTKCKRCQHIVHSLFAPQSIPLCKNVIHQTRTVNFADASS